MLRRLITASLPLDYHIHLCLRYLDSMATKSCVSKNKNETDFLKAPLILSCLLFTRTVSGPQSSIIPSWQAVQSHILTWLCYLNTQSKMDKALKANFKRMKENFMIYCFSPLTAVLVDIITLNTVIFQS